MAFTLNPQQIGTPQQTLAGIIQSEGAGNPTMMQSVANVIGNRAAVNFNGYGSSLLSQALAPSQFQSQIANPNATAMGLAGQLQAGTLPDITNGATYYSVPAYSSGPLSTLNSSNSLQIGTQYFSDQYGPASPAYMASINNPVSTVTGDDTSNIAGQGNFASYTDPNAVGSSDNAFAPTGIGTGGSNTDFNLGGNDQAVTNTDVPTTLYGNDANIGDNLGSASLVPNSFGATPSYSAADANYSIDSGDAAGNTNTAAIADNPALAGDGSSGFSIGLQTPSDQQTAFGSLPSSSDFSSSNPTSTLANPGQVDTSNIAAMNNPSQSMASVPGTTNSSSFGQTLSGMWEAMGVTATSEGDLGIAKASAQAGQTVSTGINQAATAVDTTNTGLLQSVFTAGSGWLAQGGIILFGLIFLAGGVWFFSRQEA